MSYAAKGTFKQKIPVINRSKAKAAWNLIPSALITVLREPPVAEAPPI